MAPKTLVPPQAIDIEKSVLGSILNDSNSLHKVSDVIRIESFYDLAHQEIYTAICALSASSVAIDIITVTQKLREMGKLDVARGAAYIVGLVQNSYPGRSITDHAKIIEQKFLQRQLIRSCTEAIQMAYDDANDIFELIEKHQAEVFESVKKSYGKTEVHIAEAVKDRIIDYEKTDDGMLTGVGTGWESMDRFTSGWQKTDLIIIAARPAMGKTAFAMDTAKHAAIKHGKTVGIFSLEMSTKQLTDRLISSETGIYQDKLKRKQLTELDWMRLHNNIGNLVDSQIFIDDSAGTSITSLRSKCIRMKERHNIDMVVIDYLQLMDAGKDMRGNREQEISKISRGLKMIAKELEIPVIALSQLSRAVESRPGLNGKRPMLSDLRESGSIEQDADQVLFLYRPEYYGITEDEQGRSLAGVCEIIFGKNRNGVCDTVPLLFNGALMSFTDPLETFDGTETATMPIGTNWDDQQTESPF